MKRILMVASALVISAAVPETISAAARPNTPVLEQVARRKKVKKDHCRPRHKVPEPSSVLLLGSGLASLFVLTRKKS